MRERVLLRRVKIQAQPYNDHVPFVPFRVEYWKIGFSIRVFGRWRWLGCYRRYARKADEIRAGIYAPHPWANCFDSRGWTG